MINHFLLNPFRSTLCFGVHLYVCISYIDLYSWCQIDRCWHANDSYSDKNHVHYGQVYPYILLFIFQFFDKLRITIYLEINQSEYFIQFLSSNHSNNKQWLINLFFALIQHIYIHHYAIFSIDITLFSFVIIWLNVSRKYPSKSNVCYDILRVVIYIHYCLIRSHQNLLSCVKYWRECLDLILLIS